MQYFLSIFLFEHNTYPISLQLLPLELLMMAVVTKASMPSISLPHFHPLEFFEVFF